MEELINVYLTGHENLIACFKLANTINQGYWGYKIHTNEHGKQTMYLYWCKDEGAKDANWFPYKMNAEEIADFVWGWLKRAEYGEEPDTDGSVGKGFHFKSKMWCLVENETYVCAIVTPMWFVYGK